jgi:hypothetical protein
MLNSIAPDSIVVPAETRSPPGALYHQMRHAARGSFPSGQNAHDRPSNGLQERRYNIVDVDDIRSAKELRERRASMRS